jgi:hypothetical protein
MLFCYKHKKLFKNTDTPIHNCFNQHFLLSNITNVLLCSSHYTWHFHFTRVLQKEIPTFSSLQSLFTMIFYGTVNSSTIIQHYWNAQSWFVTSAHLSLHVHVWYKSLLQCFILFLVISHPLSIYEHLSTLVYRNSTYFLWLVLCLHLNCDMKVYPA